MTKPKSIGGLLGLMASFMSDYRVGNGLTESIRSKQIAQALIWGLEYVEALQSPPDIGTTEQ